MLLNLSAISYTLILKGFHTSCLIGETDYFLKAHLRDFL